MCRPERCGSRLRFRPVRDAPVMIPKCSFALKRNNKWAHLMVFSTFATLWRIEKLNKSAKRWVVECAGALQPSRKCRVAIPSEPPE